MKAKAKSADYDEGDTYVRVSAKVANVEVHLDEESEVETRVKAVLKKSRNDSDSKSHANVWQSDGGASGHLTPFRDIIQGFDS